MKIEGLRRSKSAGISRLVGIVIGFIAFLTYGTVFADQYLCVPEKATGFKYMQKTNSWEQFDFKPVAKFKIHDPKVDPEYKYFVENIVKSDMFILPYRCKEEFSDKGFLHCEIGGNKFIFNKKSSRFTVSNIALSYAHVDVEANKREFSDIVKLSDAGSAPSLIAIGTCSPIEN